MTKTMSNLIIRTLTGIAFVAVLVGGIMWNNVSFTVLFAAITGLSVWEFCHLVNQKSDVKINNVICTTSGVFLFLAVGGFCSEITPSAVFIPYLLSLIYLMVGELYLKSDHAINNWAYTMMSQLYVALPFACLNALAYQVSIESGIIYSPILPLSIFVFLWLNDSGAYCFGSLLGKHKLFPRISPNKSWEGSIGGAIVALAASQLFAAYFDTTLTAMEWLGLALVVVVFGTWGDLVESLFKRQLGIKDSGNILPGHGGMLDRFDSSMLAIPASVVYLYTLLIL